MLAIRDWELDFSRALRYHYQASISDIFTNYLEASEYFHVYSRDILL
jgi:hypothetical protein